MARPTPTPYLPQDQKPVTRAGYMADPWVLYFNKVEEFVRTLTRRGTRAEQPAATSVYPGTLYFITDECAVERSNGNAWETWSCPAGGTGTVTNSGSLTLDFLILGNGGVDIRADGVDTQRLVGRDTAGTGAVEQVSISTALDWLGP